MFPGVNSLKGVQSMLGKNSLVKKTEKTVDTSVISLLFSIKKRNTACINTVLVIIIKKKRYFRIIQ